MVHKRSQAYDANLAIHANFVGNQQIIWTDTTGQRADDLFITAHGGYDRAAVFRTPTWLQQLIFYGPHGYLLNDPTTASVAYVDAEGRAVERVEVIAAGQWCHNYGLSKYQQREGGETYASIVMAIQLDRGVIQLAHGALNRAPDIESYDILTIRHRILRTDPTLEDVLVVLDRNPRWHYPRIHCLFCRGKSDGPDLSYDVRRS